MNERKKLPLGLEKEQITKLWKSVLVLISVCIAGFAVIIGAKLLADIYEDATHHIDSFAAMERVLPAPIYELYDFEFEEGNNIVAAYEAYDGGTSLGYCIETKAAGYDGNVSVLVGIDTEGKVTGVEIVEMSETQGIGTKIREESFLSRFVSKSGMLTAVKTEPKDDSQISVISGATTSSEAVCKGVNNALAAVSQIKAEREMNTVGEVAE